MRPVALSIAALACVLGCKPKAAAARRAEAPEASETSAVAPPELALTADGKKIVRICADEADTFPWSFTKDGEVRGIHADIARAALAKAGFAVQFKFLPWARCIEHDVKTGASDMALSAAWSETRAAYLWYPADARALGPKCKSPSALICNGPVLLVPEKSDFRFTGDVATIPQPVRATFGYAQVDELKAKGLAVDVGPGDKFNVGKLVRDGTGSALIWQLSIANIDNDPRLKGKYRVVDGYTALSDGFLPVSPQGRLSREDAARIWTSLAALRADPGFQQEITERYVQSADAP